jgi:hypothetical protein
MALPFLLPLLFSAGSMAANSIGANRRDNEIAGVLNAERRRQKQFDDESYALNDASRNRYNDVQGTVGTASNNLAEMFNAPVDEAPAQPVAALPQSDSNLVVSSEARARAGARTETDQRARDLGALRGFGDALGGIGRLQGRDAGQLGLIGSMRRGSQAVLPQELDAAQTAGGGWMTLGNLLNIGAGLTGNAFLSGGGGGGINIGRLFGGNSWGA